MSASTPDPRYFKDGGGLRPTWRFAVRWPRRYIWHLAVRHLPWRYAKLFRRHFGGFRDR